LSKNLFRGTVSDFNVTIVFLRRPQIPKAILCHFFLQDHKIWFARFTLKVNKTSCCCCCSFRRFETLLEAWGGKHWIVTSLGHFQPVVKIESSKVWGTTGMKTAYQWGKLICSSSRKFPKPLTIQFLRAGAIEIRSVDGQQQTS